MDGIGNSFQKVFLTEDGKYFVRRMNPDTISFDEAFQFTEIILDSFADNLNFQYCFGADYKYDDFVNDVRDKVQEPKLRLSSYIKRAKAFERLSYAFARNVHLSILSRIEDYYGMYLVGKDGEKDKLIGFFAWKYPSSLTESTYDNPMTLATKVYLDFIRIKYNMQDWWSFLGTGIHPMRNSRAYTLNSLVTKETQHIPDTIEEGNRLAKLSYDELVNSPYRNKDYIYLAFFVIRRGYQRQGLGSLLFNYCINVLPKANVQFRSDDGLFTSIGPAKQYVIATPAGKALYSKFGFEIKRTFYSEPEGKKEFATISYRLDRE